MIRFPSGQHEKQSRVYCSRKENVRAQWSLAKKRDQEESTLSLILTRIGVLMSEDGTSQSSCAPSPACSAARGALTFARLNQTFCSVFETCASRIQWNHPSLFRLLSSCSLFKLTWVRQVQLFPQVIFINILKVLSVPATYLWFTTHAWKKYLLHYLLKKSF